MDIHKKIDSYIKEGRPVDADFILEIYRFAKNTYKEEELKSIMGDLKQLVKMLKKSQKTKSTLQVKQKEI